MKPDKEKTKTTPQKKTDSKVFDVRRPGKALAPPTSKPVIVGHKPSAQQAQTAISGVGEARPLMTKRKIEILPTGDLEVKPVVTVAPKAADKVPVLTAASAPTVPAKPTQEDAEALATAALDAVTGPPNLPVQEPIKTPAISAIGSKIKALTSPDQPAKTGPPAPAQPQPMPALQAEDSAQPASEPKPNIEPQPEPAAKAEPELTDKELPAESSSMPDIEPVKDSAAKEEPAPEPVIEPLFDDSGAIIVSNHEHHHRRHGFKVITLLLLILILAAAALDIALDLGLLTLESLPHTDFL